MTVDGGIHIGIVVPGGETAIAGARGTIEAGVPSAHGGKSRRGIVLAIFSVGVINLSLEGGKGEHS